MNIHPILVHFPVALLSTYAILELIRFRFVTKQSYWFYLKAILVILGASAAGVVYLTGDTAKSLITDKSLRPLISRHESFAQLTIIFFGILAVGYLVAWLKRSKVTRITNIPILGQLWQFAIWVQGYITETKITLLLAFLGLICLVITGALGGSVVYGHTGDPVTNYVYHLFFK